MAKLIGRWIDKTTITNFHIDHTDSYELGNLWITGDSTFTGDSSFLSDASISGNLKVDGTVVIGSTISIDSSRILGSGDIIVSPSGTFRLASDSTFESNVDVEGELSIGTISALATPASIFLTYDNTSLKSRTVDQVRSDIGAASFTGTANYYQKIDSDGTGFVDALTSDDGTSVTIGGDSTISGNLKIDGTAQIGSGTLTIDSSRIISSSDILLSPSGILSISSDASFSGDTTVGDLYASRGRGPGFRRSVALSMFGSDETVSVGSGTTLFPVPNDLSGWRLVDVIATVDSTGDTSSTDIMIRRKRDGSTAYMLSTAVTLSSEYYARDGVIDTNYDDIGTGDNLFVDVDATEVTAPVGLSVGLTFEI